MAVKHRNRRRQDGNAVVEFAIGSSMFLAIFVATFQYGFTFFVYNDLLSAVRAGARYGSMAVYDAAVPTVGSVPTSDFVTAVKNVTVYGHPEGAASGAQPVVDGLTPSQVRVDVSFAAGLPHLVTVSIQGYQVNAVFGKWTANNKPSATFAFTGRYGPPE